VALSSTANTATISSQYEARSSLLGPESNGSGFAPYSGTGGYYERQNTQPAQPAKRKSITSKMYLPNSRWTWSFFLITLSQAIIGLGLEGFVFAKFQQQLVKTAQDRRSSDHGNYSLAIPTDLSLLIFGFVYQLVLVWDSLRSQNTIQIIGLVLMNLGILIYTAIQKDQVYNAVANLQEGNFIQWSYWDDVSGYLTALPCVVALGTVLLGFVAWKLYGEFGWNIYKKIGADRRMKNRYLIYQIYITLLKFDFFLFVGFEVQFLVLVGQTSDSERWLTVAAIPITVALLLLAAWCTQRENIIGSICTMVVYFCMVAYFIFKLVRMYDSDRAADYAPARRTLTVFAVFTLLLIVITIVVASWCMLNFNKGLKDHLLKRPESSGSNTGGKPQPFELEYAGQPGYNQFGPRPYGGSRMEID
jgi:heme/copper-type cytochrome/quinol oxidase subunit 4